MAQLSAPPSLASRYSSDEPVAVSYTLEQCIAEAWAQGFNFGSLVILILFVLCNYRRGVLLHKLILLELLLAIGHSFFIFFKDPTFGWVLSSTATPLYISYTVHNVIAWLKIRPFLPRRGGLFFIISLLAVQPYWIVEMYANFRYFNTFNNDVFQMTRYFEPLARDPWWIFTTIKLVVVINKNYEYTLLRLLRTSPRFGIMLFCMGVSVAFLVVDVIATAVISTQSGINPYWRLALVFKCASDTIFLDDFKSVLDRIAESALTRAGQTYPSGGSSRPRQVSVTTPHTSPGSFVTISARNGAGTSKGSSVGEGRENIWSVSRLTSHRRRDSSEQRILGGDAGRDDQPRIVKKTTITVSKHFGSDGPGSEASLEDSRKPDMPLQDGDLAAPTTADWANGRKRAGSSVIVGTGDVERGIPMKAWNGKKVGFE